MSFPQDPYASRSGDLPPAPPAGWPGPVGEPVPPVPLARPGTVVGAGVLWVLAGLAMVIMGGLTAATARSQEAKQALADVFADSEVQVGEAVIEQVLFTTGLVSLAMGLLTVVFGLVMLGGANWARIAVTVVGLLGILVMVFPALFVVPAIVLQFVPRSNAWFRSRALRRAV